MSRRRYLSTDISTDPRVNKLATKAGDFAALLYTWMIPHASDAGVLPGDPEQLLLIVCPGRRDKEPEDVAAALAVMQELGLITWVGDCIQFPASFYKHQTYITEKRRTAAQPQPEPPPIQDDAANQRTTPQISADERTAAQNGASFKSSFSSSSSSSFSSSVSESTGAKAPADAGASPPESPPELPVSPPPLPPAKTRTAKQQAADLVFDRRESLYQAYCRGVGQTSFAVDQWRNKGFKELAPVEKTEWTPGEMEELSHYAAIAYGWRRGKKIPSVAEVLGAFSEWERDGRPTEPKPTVPARASPTDFGERVRQNVAKASLLLNGTPPIDDDDIIETTGRVRAS